MNASERAWLKPSAARNRMNASSRAATVRCGPASRRASSPSSSQVSGTRCATLMTLSSGTQTVTAAGSHHDLRAASSASRRHRRARRASCGRAGRRSSSPSWCCTNFERSARPTAVRASARIHWATPLAVTTPSSSRPSSGSASSNASTPPNTLLTLPTRMQPARPSNHRVPVDVDRGTERLEPEVLGAGPEVGGPAEAVLQVAVGVTDHQRVEPGSRHHQRTAHRSPRPTSMVRRAPCSPTSTAARRSMGMPRLCASRLPVPAGRIASVAALGADRVDAALHHAVAAPDEHEIGSLVESPSARTRARTCSSAPRTRSDRRPRRREGRCGVRSGPPPSVFPACATTATDVMRPPPPDPERTGFDPRAMRRSCASRQRRPARRRSRRRCSRHRCRSTADHVGGVVHAPVHPRRRHADRATNASAMRRSATLEFRVSDHTIDRRRAVQRHRGGGVAGRIAVGDDEILEARDCGPVPGDEVIEAGEYTTLRRHGYQRAARTAASNGGPRAPTARRRRRPPR